MTNDDAYEQVQTPAVIKSKIGRNDPCLCGSGKKYKKCCLALEEACATDHVHGEGCSHP